MAKAKSAKKAAPKKAAPAKKKAAPAKKAASKSTGPIKAYSIGERKSVPIKDAVISKTAKGGYAAKGTDAKGRTLNTMMNEVRAQAAVRSGHAKFAKGSEPK